jgi:HEAT repeats
MIPKGLRFSACLIAITSLCLPLNAALSQSTQTQLSQDSDANARIAAILDSILRRGETPLGEGTTSRWVPPSSDEIEEVHKIGPSAIPALDKALDSHRPFEQFLAVRLLEAIGGPEIVPPLKHALTADKANSVRLAALAALRSAPDNLAVPIIRSAVRDPDALVAQRAKDLLIEYYNLPPP